MDFWYVIPIERKKIISDEFDEVIVNGRRREEKTMNTIFLIIIGIALSVELSLLMCCKHWCENNPWKWFIIKTLTTLIIVSSIVFDVKSFGKIDLVFVSIISVCFGIDFICTLIDSKNKDSYRA